MKDSLNQELYALSLLIAADQVRHYLEVNCVEHREPNAPPRYALSSYVTDLDEPSFEVQHRKTVDAYVKWIETVRKTMTRNEAIDQLGYWPVLDQHTVAFCCEKENYIGL
jgi:hypothetical protein